MLDSFVLQCWSPKAKFAVWILPETCQSSTGSPKPTLWPATVCARALLSRRRAASAPAAFSLSAETCPSVPRTMSK